MAEESVCQHLAFEIYRIILAVLRVCNDLRERWRAGHGGNGQQSRAGEQVAPVERNPAWSNASFAVPALIRLFCASWGGHLRRSLGAYLVTPRGEATPL